MDTAIDIAGTNRYSTNSSIFPRVQRFKFFDVILRKPEWKDKKILDIGGNCGNFILDCVDGSNDVDPENYYCLDVNNDALNYGEKLCPTANWKHHNAFNHMYNPAGEKELLFPYEDNTFDFVLAYSVYSHTTYEQLLFDFAEMRRVCKPFGQIAVTFVDLQGAEWFLEKRKVDYPNRRCVTIEELQTSVVDYKYLVDSDLTVDELYSDKHLEHMVSVYHPGWLSKQLEEAGYKNVMRFPTTGHVQKTIIVKNGRK